MVDLGICSALPSSGGIQFRQGVRTLTVQASEQGPRYVLLEALRMFEGELITQRYITFCELSQSLSSCCLMEWKNASRRGFAVTTRGKSVDFCCILA